MARARVPIRYRKNNIIVTLTYIITMMLDINVIFEFLIFSKSLEFNTFYLVRYRGRLQRYNSPTTPCYLRYPAYTSVCNIAMLFTTLPTSIKNWTRRNETGSDPCSNVAPDSPRRWSRRMVAVRLVAMLREWRSSEPSEDYEDYERERKRKGEKRGREKGSDHDKTRIPRDNHLDLLDQGEIK